MTKLFPPSHSHLWSLGDQALVSGSNFITGVLLARVMGLEAFGAYVVAQAYLLYANTFQASLVVAPMMTAVPAESDKEIQRKQLRGFFGYTLLVLCVTLGGVQFIAWLMGWWSEHLSLGPMIWPLAFAMAGYQLQDWLRRALYVKVANRAVFFSDLLAYGGQLAILAWLIYSNNLTPNAALLALALAFSGSALVTAASHGLRPSYAEAVIVIKQHWSASRDFLLTWQLQWLASQGVILLGAGMIGQQAAGAIRAAQNLLGPVNVAFQWMDNIVPVRAALHLRDRGRHSLITYLGRLGLTGGVALGVFALLLLPIDEWLMTLLYGEEYRPFAILVVFQALYYFFGYGYRMAAYYHRAMGETRLLAHASACWAVLSVALALLTVRVFGERGIMLALVSGEVTALVYLAWSWRDRFAASAARADRAGKPAYVVHRRRDGSVHLVLPFFNKQVLKSALRMYYPSRWTGRLYRRALAATLPLRIWLGWVETVETLADLCPDLTPILNAVPESNPACIGLLKGAPGPRAKLTLKIMDGAGNSLAYARIADSPGAITVLQREARVLTEAAKRESCFPRVIVQGEYSHRKAFFIVESAGPEQSAEPTLAERHFAFLTLLLGSETISWSSAIDQLEKEVSHLLREPGLATLIAKSLTVLRKTTGPDLKVCIEHGDFTPWNIRASTSGELFVLDWEHSRARGLPWLDALHFVYQMETLVRRKKPAAVLRALRQLFVLPVTTEYAANAVATKVLQNRFIMIYFLRMLVVGAADGCSPTSRDQVARCEVLELSMA